MKPYPPTPHFPLMIRPSCPLIIFFIYQVRSSEKGEAKNHQRSGAFCCCTKYQNTTTTKVFTNLTSKPGNMMLKVFNVIF